MNERIDHDKLESQEVRRIGSLPLSLPQTQRLTAPCESVIIDCNGRSLQVDLVPWSDCSGRGLRCKLKS